MYLINTGGDVIETGSNTPAPNKRKSEAAAENKAILLKIIGIMCALSAAAVFIFSRRSLFYSGIELILFGLFFIFLGAGMSLDTGNRAKPRISSLPEDVQQKNKMAVSSIIAEHIFASFILYGIIFGGIGLFIYLFLESVPWFAIGNICIALWFIGESIMRLKN